MNTLKQVKEALNRRRVTQTEFARLSGVSQSTISRLDNSCVRDFQRTALPSTLRKLAEGLKNLSSGRRPALNPVKACAGTSRTRAPRGKANSR